MADDESKTPPAKKAAAKKAETKGGLAAVADAGLASVPEPEGPSQGVFENTDYTKVTFIGANYQSIEFEPKIGDEVQFIVTGRIKEIGDRVMANGFTQHFGKVDVQSITRKE